MVTCTSKTAQLTAAHAMTPERPQSWMIFELEEAVEGLRDRLCEVIAAQLKEEETARVADMMLRCGLCSSPELAARAVATALGARSAALEALGKAVTSWLSELLTSEAAALRESYRSAIEAAAERGYVLAVLSTAPEDSARAFVRNRIEPLAPGIRLHAVTIGTGGFPTPEHWRVPLQVGQVPPSLAVALVTTRASFKTALVAGLRGLAAPDRFTQAHDFSGADLVLEFGHPVDKARIAEVL